MVPFTVLALGTGSATPTDNRHPAAQVVNYNGKLFLIDCGEGTQIQLRKYRVKIQRIEHILISHLHGDHYYGLPGLIGTMDLLGRKSPLHIHCPPDLEKIIDVIHRHSHVVLDFPLVFHQLSFDAGKMIVETDRLVVESFPVKHRIECAGFIFREKRGHLNIRKEAISKYSLSFSDIIKIKNGDSFTASDGEVIPNEKLTIPPTPLRSYVYCTDTLYDESLIPIFSNTDLLYHDATFGNDKANRAGETFHSTAEQAALLASKAQVKKLLLGHFSSRYDDVGTLLNEAVAVFPSSVIAKEGETYNV